MMRRWVVCVVVAASAWLWGCGDDAGGDGTPGGSSGGDAQATDTGGSAEDTGDTQGDQDTEDTQDMDADAPDPQPPITLTMGDFSWTLDADARTLTLHSLGSDAAPLLYSTTGYKLRSVSHRESPRGALDHCGVCTGPATTIKPPALSATHCSRFLTWTRSSAVQSGSKATIAS